MPKLRLQEDTPLPTMPDGTEALATVESITERESRFEDKDGKKKTELSWVFKLQDGEYKDRIVYGRTPTIFSTWANNKTRIWIQEIMGEDDLPVDFEVDTEVLVGLTCKVMVGKWERMGDDGKTMLSGNYVADVIRDTASSVNPF